MIIGEQDNEKQAREETEDYLKRVNRGRRCYIDEFTSTSLRDWETIKKIIRKKRNAN